MTDWELLELRAKKWRIDGNPIRTLEDAQEFIESVGFCLMYPLRPRYLPRLLSAPSRGRIRICRCGSMPLPIRARSKRPS